MIQHIDPCEIARVRVLAAALVLQQCTKTAANIVPIPGQGQIIAIGTRADVARLLELAPVAATTQASTAQAERVPVAFVADWPYCNPGCDYEAPHGGRQDCRNANCSCEPAKASMARQRTNAATSSTDAQAAAEVREPSMEDIMASEKARRAGLDAAFDAIRSAGDTGGEQ